MNGVPHKSVDLNMELESVGNLFTKSARKERREARGTPPPQSAVAGLVDRWRLKKYQILKFDGCQVGYP